MTEEKITSEVLGALLARADYDAATGRFVYKVVGEGVFKNTQAMRRWNSLYAGKVAGATKFINGKKYLLIKVGYRPYLAHRLIFFMLKGFLPPEIDHADGDGLNNRIDNLLPASRAINAKNQRRHKDRELPTGVSETKGEKFCHKPYSACIKADGTYVFLGFFNSIDEAANARKAAEKKYGFHPNHGSVRPK